LIVIVVHKDSGTELLKETAWEGEAPRHGDVMELHCGDTSRWRVDEVDWVFADTAKDQHDDVPLKHLRVVVTAYDDKTGKELDPMCACGHRQSIHSPNGCTGRSHTCDCSAFSPA
jgi:hypothetical protein